MSEMTLEPQAWFRSPPFDSKLVKIMLQMIASQCLPAWLRLILSL